MTPPALLLGLVLSTSAAQAQAPTDAPSAERADARDPWGLLSLADSLAAEGGRDDELVAVLVAALEDETTRSGAVSRLQRKLVSQAPRAAWSDAYGALVPLLGPADAKELQLRAAQAGADHPASRGAAIGVLERRLAQDPSDSATRLALGDAYLRSGDADRALRTFREGRSGAQVWRGEVAALLVLGRYDDALQVGAELVPTSCKTTRMPAPCAIGLQQMGYHEAAVQSLERARAQGGDGARSRSELANLVATQARVQERLTGRADTAPLWAEAVKLEPRDRTYAVGLVEALLEGGRVAEARQHVPSPDDPLSRTIEAVALATSVNLDSTEPSVTHALEQARRLDGSHPSVIRAWAHHLIVMGQAEEAARLLEAGTRARTDDPAWVSLYTWASWKAGRTDRAVDMLRATLAGARSTADWFGATAEMARFNGILAEQYKSAGQLDAARTQYLLAHAMDRRAVSPVVGLGGVRWQAGDLAGAERAYRVAWALAPGNRQALMALVLLLKAQGREEEARGLLAAGGYTDVMARRLERELEMLELSRDARLAREAGRPDEARARYEDLLTLYPNDITLLHALADTLSEMKRHEAAAEAYGHARDIDPEDPWLAMGEIRSRIALDQLDRATLLLDAMDPPRDGDAREAWHRVRSAMRRAQADRLTRSGDARGSYAMYAGAIAERPDPVLFTGLAGLYLSRWQYNAAEAWYEEALRLDPSFGEAERGLIAAQAARGDFAAAQRRAGALCARQPSPENIDLAKQIARHHAMNQAAGAAIAGDWVQARRILEDQRAAAPTDLDVRVALAALELGEGNAEAAYTAAEAILAIAPAHPGALSTLQAAGLRLRRASQVLAAYTTAQGQAAAPWLDEELGALTLAVRLDAARAAHAAGALPLAEQTMTEAIGVSGDGSSRHWALIGGAWLDMGRPDDALAAFETARHINPDDTGAVLGVASAYRTRGQLSDAEQLLADQWTRRKDPEIGLALAQVQADRGRTAAAARTLDEVKALARQGRVSRSRAAPAPLPVGALPSGRVAAPEDPTAPPPDRDPVLPNANLKVAGKGIETPYRGSVALGVGLATRPGVAGAQFMRLQSTPLAAELALLGPLRLQAEVVPLRVTDGLREASGVAASAGLATAPNPAFSAHGRIGSSAAGQGFGVDPYLTWSAAARGRLADRFDVGVEGARAPVTDSFTSLAGVRDGASGQLAGGVHDTWVGAQAGHTWDTDATTGALARWGTAAGPNLGLDGTGPGAVAWDQAVLWARAPLRTEADRSLWLGFEGMSIGHDRPVDGLGVGQAGMFSPQRFTTGMLRLEARWGIDPRQKIQACGVIGAGPQQLRGQSTLYLNPGSSLGYELRGSLHADLGNNLGLVAHALHQGTWAVWGQNAVLMALRYGRPGTSLAAPSPAFASGAHGAPLLEPSHCGFDWKEGPR